MQSAISSTIILLGALVMLTSILKSGATYHMLHLIPENAQKNIRGLLNAHRILMFIFLVGYVVVAIAFLMDFHIIGQFFVGVIFLLGASFVLMGILIQSKMLFEIRSTLHGILPICAGCKKIRLENSNQKDIKSWVPIESYIKSKTNANFSHGICPECFERFYPEKIEDQD